MKKKSTWFFCVPMLFSAIAFSGCGAQNANTGKDEDEPIAIVAPEEEKQSSNVHNKETIAASPFAALDKIDLKTAFSNDGGQKSVGLKTNAQIDTEISARLYSELSDSEKFSVTVGAGIFADDLLGVRFSDQTASNATLYGGGSIGVTGRFRGPYSSSGVSEKTLKAEIYHDGEWVFLTTQSGEQTSIAASELGGYLADMAGSATLERVLDAATVLPETAAKGLDLHAGVEKLIDLGFTAQVTETDGVCLRVSAKAGLYTDLFNDAIESVLPAEWLKYLPRIDVRYDSDLIELLLSFDANGTFRSYSLASDVRVEADLRIRGLFSFTSSYSLRGGFTVSACDESPAPDGAETV